MISLLVVASTAFILISASSLYTVLSVSSTFTSTTSINFLSCLTSWSSVFSSLFVVIVILERSCCSVDPTVMLSMLKLRALKRLVTLKSTPGLFSTRADTMYHDPFWTVVVDNFFHYAPIIISLRPVPGATNGYTSSSGSIGMSITVATSDLSAALIAFSSSCMDPTLMPCAPYASAILT